MNEISYLSPVVIISTVKEEERILSWIETSDVRKISGGYAVL